LTGGAKAYKFAVIFAKRLMLDLRVEGKLHIKKNLLELTRVSSGTCHSRSIKPKEVRHSWGSLPNFTVFKGDDGAEFEA
jgi:hypothetical protein